MCLSLYLVVFVLYPRWVVVSKQQATNCFQQNKVNQRCSAFFLKMKGTWHLLEGNTIIMIWIAANVHGCKKLHSIFLHACYSALQKGNYNQCKNILWSFLHPWALATIHIMMIVLPSSKCQVPFISKRKHCIFDCLYSVENSLLIVVLIPLLIWFTALRPQDTKKGTARVLSLPMLWIVANAHGCKKLHSIFLHACYSALQKGNYNQCIQGCLITRTGANRKAAKLQGPPLGRGLWLRLTNMSTTLHRPLSCSSSLIMLTYAVVFKIADFSEWFVDDFK